MVRSPQSPAKTRLALSRLPSGPEPGRVSGGKNEGRISPRWATAFIKPSAGKLRACRFLLHCEETHHKPLSLRRFLKPGRSRAKPPRRKDEPGSRRFSRGGFAFAPYRAARGKALVLGA